MGPNWFWPIHANQMRASHDSVDVDNLRDLLMIEIIIAFDNPHPSVGIWLIVDTSEPVDEGAMIVRAVILESEEDADLSNVNAQHALLVWVRLDKDGVVSRSAFPPRWRGVNTFAPHTLSAAYVTRCVEMSNGGVVY